MNRGTERSIGDILSDRKYNFGLRFTTVYHPVREKFYLTTAQYMIIDSIDQLSHRPDHPWCEVGKEKLGKFIGATRQTVHTSIKVGIEKGLIEKQSEGTGLRSTMKWIQEVRIYRLKQ